MNMYSRAARMVRHLGCALRDAARWARRSSKRKTPSAHRRPIRMMDDVLFTAQTSRSVDTRLEATLAAHAAGRTIPPPVQHLTRLLNVMPGSRARCPHLVMVETTLVADMKDGFSSLGMETLLKAMDQLSDLVPIAAGTPLDTLQLQMRRRYGELRAREDATRRAQERMGMVRPQVGSPIPRSSDFMFGGATVTELPSSHMPGVAEIVVQPPPPARNDARLGAGVSDALRHLEAGDLRAMRDEDSPTQWMDTEIPADQGFGGPRHRA